MQCKRVHYPSERSTTIFRRHHDEVDKVFNDIWGGGDRQQNTFTMNNWAQCLLAECCQNHHTGLLLYPSASDTLCR